MKVSLQQLMVGLALSVVGASSAFADTEPPPCFFCEEGLGREVRWRYASEDDPRFADPAFDASGWPFARPLFEAGRAPAGWRGVGWFRRRVTVPEARLGQPVGIFAMQVGAFELYVNGRRVLARGLDGDGPPRASASAFGELVGQFEPREIELVLAMRVATPAAGAGALGIRGWVGAWIELCEPIPAVAAIRGEVRQVHLVYGGFIGITCALGLLHLLLAASVREGRGGHLDYAFFNLASASLAGSILARGSGGSIGEIRLATILFLGSIVLVTLFSVRFFALTAHGPLSRVRAWAPAVAVPALLLCPWLSIQVIYVFALVGLLLDAWLVEELVRKRRPERFLILGGVWAMLIATAVQLAPELLGAGPRFDFAFVPGFVALLAVMSVHLARSVGRTQGALAERVSEVERLSEAHLQDQARAQVAELERVALAAENRQQAERLEAAERRAALMDELAETNRALHETRAQLVQSEKMASLGQLVAGVAHEMNTPIGAIGSVHQSMVTATRRLRERLTASTGDSVKDRKLEAALEVLEDGAGVIGRGSARVSDIVRRLRTFARLDQAALQRADVHEGIEDTLVLARHELKQGIQVVKDFGRIDPIDCYPGQLNQVFLNLVVNARQAMGSKGTLTISTRDVGDEIEIRFRDDGPGIPPEHLARIFDPGFTTKGVGVGTGLGLAICFRLVEAHQGRLTVESTVGEGATFVIRLPKNLRRQQGESPDDG